MVVSSGESSRDGRDIVEGHVAASRRVNGKSSAGDASPRPNGARWVGA